MEYILKFDWYYISVFQCHCTSIIALVVISIQTMFACKHLDGIQQSNVHQICKKFDLSDKYAHDAKNVYDCLLRVFGGDDERMHTFSKLIAEYAATIYLNCISCDRSFGCIECYKDYGEFNGATALLSDNGDAIFYLNINTSRWYASLQEAGDFSDIDVMLFCSDCGLRWNLPTQIVTESKCVFE